MTSTLTLRLPSINGKHWLRLDVTMHTPDALSHAAFTVHPEWLPFIEGRIHDALQQCVLELSARDGRLPPLPRDPDAPTLPA